MERYNFENLSRLIGDQVFLQDGQGNRVELTIAEVNKGKLDGDEWEAFSVIHTTEKNIFIPQGTYTICHGSFGESQLFLSPNSETEYEIVVNRRRKELT